MPSADAFVLGIVTHVGQRTRPIDKTLATVAGLGANSIRDEIYWAYVESQRGVLRLPKDAGSYMDAATRSSIAPLVILDYGNRLYEDGKAPTDSTTIQAFSRYAQFLAGELRGKVSLFEVWNEWDSAGNSPKTPESYFKLLKSTYAAVKTSNSQATVVAGAITPEALDKGWLRDLVRLGVQRYADGISVHPYVHCGPRRTPERWREWMKQIADELPTSANGKPLPLYVTEMGWPTNEGPCGISRAVAARYTARTLLLARTIPSLEGLWWYDLQDDGKDPRNREHNFGLVTWDWQRKPAYYAFRFVSDLVTSAISATPARENQGVWVLDFLRFDHSHSWAVWREEGADPNSTAEFACTSNGILEVQSMDGGRTSHHCADRGEVYSVPLNTMPVVVKGPVVPTSHARP